MAENLRYTGWEYSGLDVDEEEEDLDAEAAAAEEEDEDYASFEVGRQLLTVLVSFLTRVLDVFLLYLVICLSSMDIRSVFVSCRHKVCLCLLQTSGLSL